MRSAWQPRRRDEAKNDPRVGFACLPLHASPPEGCSQTYRAPECGVNSMDDFPPPGRRSLLLALLAQQLLQAPVPFVLFLAHLLLR